MPCAIWYHLYNLKKVKNTHGGVILLVSIFHVCFSRFLNCANGTKSLKRHIRAWGFEKGVYFSRLVCFFTNCVRYKFLEYF